MEIHKLALMTGGVLCSIPSALFLPAHPHLSTSYCHSLVSLFPACVSDPCDAYTSLCVCTSTSFTRDAHLCSPLLPQTLLEKALVFGSHSAVPQSSSEESSSAKVLQSEQLTTSSPHVCHVLLNVGDSVVDEGVRSKLSEAVKELVGVEGRLYCSLDGILGRNVKRVQDGLKRVREAMETEGRSDAKDDFSTLDKKRKWIEVCVCACGVCVQSLQGF